MRNKILLTIFSVWAMVFLAACGSGELEGNVEENNDVAKEDATKVGENENEDTESTEDFDQNSADDIQEDEPVENSKNKRLDGELTVHFIDVGQADATLFEYVSKEEEYRILFDAGNWNSNDVVHYLQSEGVSYIDIFIGSHIHSDHIGQMDKVMEAIEVGEVWMTGNTGTSQTFLRVLDAIEASSADYHEPRAGEVYDVGPLVVELLHPTSLKSDANKNSISMKLTYGDVSFMMTGDAESDNEASMIAGGFDLDADILQLGHHGSSTSTTEAFLRAVSPDVAIYSAGSENSYGHPHAEVVSLVQNNNIELYGTDVHGTIIVTTDGVTYTLVTEKEGTVVAPSTKSNESSKSQNKSISKNNKSKKKEASPSPSGSCIDINSATLEELQGIMHIGPARAEELMELRPFQSVDSLTRINGIGAGRLKDIKAENNACVGG